MVSASLFAGLLASASTVSAFGMLAKRKSTVTTYLTITGIDNAIMATGAVTEHIKHHDYFCEYYLRSFISSHKSKSPLPGLTTTQLTSACKRVLRGQHITIPKTGSGPKASRVPSLSSTKCNYEQARILRDEFTYPKAFCKYMQSL
ncbi:hypothetical protein ANO11243_061460 [Dothideomycetidae sp. 11243]|nr:hypothetical protein ANO11243_061460 [fungal sp. No.11243]